MRGSKGSFSDGYDEDKVREEYFRDRERNVCVCFSLVTNIGLKPFLTVLLFHMYIHTYIYESF